MILALIKCNCYPAFDKTNLHCKFVTQADNFYSRKGLGIFALHDFFFLASSPHTSLGD